MLRYAGENSPAYSQGKMQTLMKREHQDFYKKIRAEIKNWLKTKTGKDNKWAEYILLAPDLFHLLAKLLVDPDVPSEKKVKLLAAVIYFISPIDFLPEGILGPAAYVDDIAIAAYTLNDLINSIDPQIVVRNWAGEHDILLLVKNILINANEMIGSRTWEKIKKRFFK